MGTTATAVAAWASPRAEVRSSAPPLQLQLVSFSYERGQPRDTLANLNARVLPNPGRSARGRTGLDRRLARDVLATPGATELCEKLEAALRKLIGLVPADHSILIRVLGAAGGYRRRPTPCRP